MFEVFFAYFRDGESSDKITMDLNAFVGKSVRFVECHFEVDCKDLCEKHLGIWVYSGCNVNDNMIRRHMS